MSLNLSVRGVVRAYAVARGPCARVVLAREYARWDVEVSAADVLAYAYTARSIADDVRAACADVDAGALGGAA